MKRTVTAIRKNMFAQSVLLAEGQLRGASRFAALAAFLSIFSIFGGCKTATAANEPRQLEIQLEDLRTIKEIILMIVPRGMSFRSRITREALPKAACVYQISSTERSLFDDAINTLRAGILEYETGPADIGEIRIGIRFKGTGIPQDFYFQDWEGRQNVSGVSGEHRILASADLPDRLRALVSRTGVILASDAFGGCLRS